MENVRIIARRKLNRREEKRIQPLRKGNFMKNVLCLLLILIGGQVNAVMRERQIQMAAKKRAKKA